jgi:sterol desaturase/sphingolipid hydroxylase (fatty acid hydroxylase superfamily)
MRALAELAARLHLGALALSTLKAGAVLVVLFVFVFVCESRKGSDRSRYLTKNFFNDVLYSLFYRGGLYGVLTGAIIANALGHRLDFFKVGVLQGLPLPVAAVLAWLTTDFLGYWIHRLQHHSRFLWAFHSVHHSQERMTFLTSYRIHPIEIFIANIIMFIPLLVLGVPTTTWVPLYVVQNGLEFVQHADLDWRYGKLYRLIVSPLFHNFHHSATPEHYNRNFGKVLSIWDFVFGTAVLDGQHPQRTGVDGLHMPESIAGQLITPFRMLREQFFPKRRERLISSP